MKKYILACLVLISLNTSAQTDSTDNFDYSKFGDAEGVKRYATQKVINQTPQRILSIGYEYQGGFTMPGVKLGPLLPAFQDFRVEQVQSIRAQANIPVVSNNKIIWQMGLNYWSSKFSIPNASSNTFTSSMNANALTSVGINSLVFKPLNETNFLRPGEQGLVVLP